MKFPFDEAPDTAVITCCHVMNGSRPILHVTHDEEDGMWQFLCGGAHDVSEGRSESLHDIFALDPSLAKIARMPCGCAADRRKANARWIIQKRGFPHQRA